MENLAPSGPVYQAGTLSGNPLAMSAGIATLNTLKRSDENYVKLDKRTSYLCGELQKAFHQKGIPVRINRAGSMFTVFFTKEEVFDFSSAATSDTKLYGHYFREMLSHHIYIAPSQYEASFLSFAHTDEDIEKTLEACVKTLKSL
jgi:glutamate-1-semialdehyde 2,1-aminomutase